MSEFAAVENKIKAFAARIASWLAIAAQLMLIVLLFTALLRLLLGIPLAALPKLEPMHLALYAGAFWLTR